MESKKFCPPATKGGSILVIQFSLKTYIYMGPVGVWDGAEPRILVWGKT